MTICEWIHEQQREAWSLQKDAPNEVSDLAVELCIFWETKLRSLTIEQAEIEIAADGINV